MWRWLSIPTLLLALSPSSQGSPTSVGPTSGEEATLLWQEGELALSNSRFQDAVNLLSRLVNRYPGTPEYLKARLLLGQALIELGKPEDAVPLIKNYLLDMTRTPESIQGRIWLSRAYFDLKKYTEAYLTTLEIDPIATATAPQSDLMVQAALAKTRALLGLKHPDRARLVLDYAEKLLSKNNGPEIRGQTHALHLEIKTLECARFPSQEPLSENQLRDQLERRGTCLLESLLIYREILKSEDLRSSSRSTLCIIHAFEAYRQTCSFTARPPHDPALKRTSMQTKQYQKELKDRLLLDSSQKFTAALELIKSWQPEFPKSTAELVSQTSQKLENLIQRTSIHDNASNN